MIHGDDTCDQCGLDPCGCGLEGAPGIGTWIFSKPAPAPPAPAEIKPAPDPFAAFLKANPHVGAELLRLARARLAQGERRIGTKALFEELRGVLRTQSKDYNLNNNLTAPAARWLISEEPKLVGVIELRRRKGE